MKYNGLTTAQVNANRKKYGANIIPMPAPKSAWYFFIDVFRDRINFILLIMLGLFVGLGLMGFGDLYEAIGIGTVLAVVTSINIITQLRAQSSARALQINANMHSVRVMRGGALRTIDCTDIVVGDIVLLGAGEIICADGYMVDGEISVNNSILNGEAEEVEKRPVRGYVFNRARTIGADDYTNRNSVFAGTTVQSGAGKMCVTHVGAATQSAEILTSLHNVVQVRTSLQIQIDNMADKISRLGGISAFLIFIVLVATQYMSGNLGDGFVALRTVLGDITVALTVFVAAVPEGLPFIISIIIGRNTARMAKNHILPKNPQKIPAAGNLHIICTDKTGTLTYGRLAVVSNFLGDGTDIGAAVDCSTMPGHLFCQNSVLNTGASYDAAGNIVGGNSTDRAILSSVKNINTREFNIIKQVPFNSAAKFAMTIAHNKTDDADITFVRGAPEIVLNNCTHYIDGRGRTKKLDWKTVDDLLKRAAGKSMRLVASAYVSAAVSGDRLPQKMTLICITAMRDELRPGVPDVVRSLHHAGIQVIMITGDNIETARSIARDCGIVNSPDDIVILASTLETHTDDWLRRNLSRLRVVARATPATKLRLVTVAQSLNKSIGMCGDGTNDAPALRRADVGFALGDGTDVCKEASDMVITDNNFVSVAASVLIGRTFLHNIISFLWFQLPINFALVVLCLAFPLLFGGAVMSAVQILIINIVMDSMNSLSFGGEPPHAEYMDTPAPRKGAPLLSHENVAQIAVSTIMFLAIFGILLTPRVAAMFPGEYAYTGARFALLVIMAILNGFNIRTGGYNLFAGLRQNPLFVWIAVSVIAGCVLCVSFGGAAIAVAPLNITQWAVIFGLAFLIVPLDLLRKWIFRRIFR